MRFTAVVFMLPLALGIGFAADNIGDGRENAAAMLAAGRSAEAYDLYTSLLIANPEDDNLLYGQAVSAVSAGRPDAAISAFEKLLVRHPHDAELRLEAATAHRLAGDMSRAGSLISTISAGDMLVLAGRHGVAATQGILPSEPYYATRPGGPSGPTTLRGGARFGILYDSNANQGLSSGDFFIGYVPVQIPDAKKKSSFGAYAGLTLDFQHLLGGGSGPWAAVGDLNLYVRGYARSSLGDQNAREWQYGRAAGGMRYYGSDFFFDARLKAEVFDYEFSNRVAAVGPEFSFVKALDSRVYLITQASFEWRDYNRNSDRNGVYGEAGQYVRFFFGDGELRPYLTLGAKYLGGRADEKDFSRNGWEAQARVTVPIGCRLELSPHAAYGEDRYRGPGVPHIEFQKRKDERWRAGLDATWKLTDSWSLEASYGYVDNKSRSAVYDYDQHVVNFGVAKTF